MKEKNPYDKLREGLTAFENLISGSFQEFYEKLSDIERKVNEESFNSRQKQDAQLRNLKLLSDTVLKFSNLPRYADIYKLIAEQLSFLADDSFVLLNSFENRSFTTVNKAIVGSESFISLIESVDFKKSDIPESIVMKYASGLLIDYDSDNGPFAFPSYITEQVKSTFDFNNFYELGFGDNDELFGIAIIFSAKPLIHKRELLEAFSKICALALRKKILELHSEENLEYLAAAMDNFDDALIITKKNGQIVFLNYPAEMICGWKLSAAKGRMLKDICKLYDNSDSLIASPELIPEKANAFRLVSKSSVEHFINIEKSSINNQLNQATGFLLRLSTSKTTDNLKTETEAKPAKAGLGYFSYLAHEIRAPLNAIIGFTEILSDEIKDIEQLDFLNIIKTCSNDILKISDDVLDIAKLEAGKAAAEKYDFDVIPLIKELYEIYNSAILKGKNRNISLKLEIPENKGIIVSGDVNRFKQIFRNLLGNAIKFTKQGSVNFGLQSIDNNLVKFFVKDTGPGIEPDMKEKIFMAFQQTSNTKTQGTGLGLTISKSFCKLMGGDMWVESAPGMGSTFYFTIPFVKSADKPEINPKPNKTEITPPEPSKIQINPSKPDEINQPQPGKINTPEPAKIEPKPEGPEKKDLKTILIVEDIKAQQEVISGICRKITENIIIAKDGREAIEFCRNNQDIDIVLLDLNLPVIDGYLAANEIKKIRKNLPIIAVTAYDIESDRENLQKQNLDDLIEKPINPEILINKVSAFLLEETVKR